MRILTETPKTVKERVGEKVSAKQRVIVLAALIIVVLVAVALLIYSFAQVQNYDGIFVSGVRQVWF